MIETYGGLKKSHFFSGICIHRVTGVVAADSPHTADIGVRIAGFGFSMIVPASRVEAVKLVPVSIKGLAVGGYGLSLDLQLELTGPLIGVIASHFGILYIFFSMIMVNLGSIISCCLQREQAFYPGLKYVF